MMTHHEVTKDTRGTKSVLNKIFFVCFVLFVSS